MKMKKDDISPVQIEYDRRSRNKAGPVRYSNRTNDDYIFDPERAFMSYLKLLALSAIVLNEHK